MSTFDELYFRWLAVYRERLVTSLPDERIQEMARAATLRGDEPPPLSRKPFPIDAATLRKQAEDAFNLSYLDEAKLWLSYRVVKKKGLPVVKIWLAQFWNDPAYFAAAMRGIIVTACQLVVQGIIVVPWFPQAGWFASVVLSGLAVGIPAGQKNRPPEEIKAIALDPTIVPKT